MHLKNLFLELVACVIHHEDKYWIRPKLNMQNQIMNATVFCRCLILVTCKHFTIIFPQNKPNFLEEEHLKNDFLKLMEALRDHHHHNHFRALFSSTEGWAF